MHLYYPTIRIKCHASWRKQGSQVSPIPYPCNASRSWHCRALSFSSGQSWTKPEASKEEGPGKHTVIVSSVHRQTHPRHFPWHTANWVWQLVPSIQWKLSLSLPTPAKLGDSVITSSVWKLSLLEAHLHLLVSHTPFGCEIQRDANVPRPLSQSKWAVNLFNSAKSFNCSTQSCLSAQPQADRASLPGSLEQPLFLYQIAGGRTPVSSHQTKWTNCWKSAGGMKQEERTEIKFLTALEQVPGFWPLWCESSF